MKDPPTLLAEFDLWQRYRPAWTEVKLRDNQANRRVAVIAGELRCCDTHGRLLWTSHPAGINSDVLVAAGDLY